MQIFGSFFIANTHTSLEKINHLVPLYKTNLLSMHPPYQTAHSLHLKLHLRTDISHLYTTTVRTNCIYAKQAPSQHQSLKASQSHKSLHIRILKIEYTTVLVTCSLKPSILSPISPHQIILLFADRKPKKFAVIVQCQCHNFNLCPWEL